MTAQETLLSVKDLCTWFELRRMGFLKAGMVRAVDGVSFELKKGEAAAFVGESGCGKSSLARTLLGLYPPTKGEVLFEGVSITSLTGKARHRYKAKVGYVQQDPYGALPPFMKIKTILAEPLIVHGVKEKREREERINKVLEEVRLIPTSDYLEKFPHMLSGGQQQRTVIARALLLKPSMIIADEPVSMLDASVRVEILNLLRSIQKKRELTLGFITHDLSTVRHFADRIFVMYGGRIVEQAPVNELLDDPLHPYTKALLSAISDVDADNALQERNVPEGEPPSLVNPPPGCLFFPRCPNAIKGRCDKDPISDLEVRSSRRVACVLYE